MLHDTPRRRRRALRAGVLATTVAGAGVLGLAGTALASTASQTVNAGTLAFVSTPGNPSLSAVTLNGTDQTATGALPLDIGDNTGSGAGWNVTVTAGQFTTGGTSPHTLATSATTIQSAPTVACDTGVTCTTATNSTVTYPLTVTADGLAHKVFSAAAGSGMANQTVTPTFQVAVPANSYAGTYTATWTVSLNTGP